MKYYDVRVVQPVPVQQLLPLLERYRSLLLHICYERLSLPVIFRTGRRPGKDDTAMLCAR